jgi:hypothetical protein
LYTWHFHQAAHGHGAFPFTAGPGMMLGHFLWFYAVTISCLGQHMDESDKRERHGGRRGWLKLGASFVIIAVLVGVWYFSNPGFDPKLDSKVAYYAVTLTNGTSIYGHPVSMKRGTLVLTEVHYVVRQTNPQTNEVHNTLVSQHKSVWHNPDEMIINARHILMMEPVDPTSTVAKLMAEDKSKGE